jgi:hypothetical protein
MKNFPKQLKVGGHIYKVILVESDDIQKDCGECAVDKLEIKIKKNMPQTMQEETLIHEAIHAMNFDLPEESVQYLSMAFYQLLKDNNLLR